MKIVVIGSGTMGNGIAHSFALNGFKTSLVDINEEALFKGKETIISNLKRQVASEKITNVQLNETLDLLSYTTDLKSVTKDCDLVIEAATENIKIKLELFKNLDELCPEKTILASNTSSISITKIAAATLRPEKVIGMHFMNPVPIMKLVEIIKGYSTSTATTTVIETICLKLNKTAVTVNDFPGFIANRILIPMINEAISALHEGVAGVKEIDQIMILGMAHPMGPLQLADYIGLDVCLSIMKVLYEGFGNPKYAPNPLLVNMVAAQKLGAKTKHGFYDWANGAKNLTVSPQFML